MFSQQAVDGASLRSDRFRELASAHVPLVAASAVSEVLLQMPCVYKVVPSPIGALTLVTRGQGLSAVLWENDDPLRVRLGCSRDMAEHPGLADAEWQLAEYFAGRRRSFALDLDLQGTVFQRQVWQALLTIPFGETRSYGQIAAQIGYPTAVRAVGAANGKNPVPIIVPCHRVVGASGRLTGFAGGLEAKRFLLQLESRQHAIGWNGLQPTFSRPEPAVP